MLDNESLGSESNLPVGRQEFGSLIANCGATVNSLLTNVSKRGRPPKVNKVNEEEKQVETVTDNSLEDKSINSEEVDVDVDVAVRVDVDAEECEDVHEDADVNVGVHVRCRCSCRYGCGY